MHEDENDNSNSPLQNMSETDVMAELIDLISQEGISDNKFRKILTYVERVVSETD